jgi:hypothetical protein
MSNRWASLVDEDVRVEIEAVGWELVVDPDGDKEPLLR